MRAYIGFKFKEDFSDRESIEAVCSALEGHGIETSVMVRDVEKWGEVRLSPEEFMPRAFGCIDAADIVILEMTEKGVGLGVEAGYAHATRKPVVVIAKTGTEISETLKGIAAKIVFYDTIEDLQRADLTVA